MENYRGCPKCVSDKLHLELPLVVPTGWNFSFYLYKKMKLLTLPCWISWEMIKGLRIGVEFGDSWTPPAQVIAKTDSGKSLCQWKRFLEKSSRKSPELKAPQSFVAELWGSWCRAEHTAKTDSGDKAAEVEYFRQRSWDYHLITK